MIIAGDQLDFLRKAGQIAEKNEGLMEHVLVRIRWTPAGTARKVGADHMVVGENVVIAQCFGRLRVISNHHRVSADFGLGKNDSKTHISLLVMCPEKLL